MAGAVRVRGVREAQRVSLVNGGARSCLLSARASPRGYCCQRGARTGRPRARAKAVRARAQATDSNGKLVFVVSTSGSFLKIRVVFRDKQAEAT